MLPQWECCSYCYDRHDHLWQIESENTFKKVFLQNASGIRVNLERAKSATEDSRPIVRRLPITNCCHTILSRSVSEGVCHMTEASYTACCLTQTLQTPHHRTQVPGLTYHRYLKVARSEGHMFVIWPRTGAGQSKTMQQSWKVPIVIP